MQISESTEAESNEIGYYIGVPNLSDYRKKILLVNPWVPPIGYTFPHNVVKKSNKLYKKYAQRSHLEKFYWLVLSNKDKGLYCKYCALFSSCTGTGSRNKTVLGNLVKSPLKRFDDLLGENGYLLRHAKFQ